MPKKNLIEEALIEAEELERASIENAKEIVMESFTPDFVNFFKDILSEADEKENFKDDKDVPDDEELDDEELEEGNEHDLGKNPDPGRQGTDPAVDDDEEAQNQHMKKEGKYDDVSGDATPEKGQAGLPKKGQPKTKKVGDKGWEAEHSGGEEHADTSGSADPEKAPGDLPGKKPAVKQTGDGGWEDEGSGAPKSDKGREALKGKKLSEAEEDKEDDKEELEVPDELFDDAEDIKEADEKDDDVEIKDDFDGDDDDVEINIDLDADDDDKDSVDEGADVDIEDEDGEKPDDDDAVVDDEIDEGLYIRSEGRFKKITPAEYLQTRIESLEEERDTLSSAVETLQGQLQETHLFNAKLAHLNKLYMSGAFTNTEKERIAERLDECDDIVDVKSLYKTIITEVQGTNPLENFSNLIKENKLLRETKTENIYESNDVSRMKRIMNYEFDK